MRYSDSARKTDAQQQLLLTLGAFGPMPGHALIWKSGLPEKRAKTALRVLLHRQLVAPVAGGAALALTPAGRATS
jgi:hypothetical protein